MVKSSPERNRGVALVIALFVVAVVTVSVTQALSALSLNVARAENYFAKEQAWQYALGAESWARVVLSRDDAKVDSLNEDWATALPPLPVDRGTISGKIEDLQALMNLNGLAAGAQAELSLKRFRCLLEGLELPIELANAIADWVDEDQIPRLPGGSEEDEYLAMRLPYRSADRPMADISELRLVSGVSAEVFAKIRPFVSVLPGETTLNINTVPKEIFVCIVDGLSDQVAETLIEDRHGQPYESVAQLLEDDSLKGLDTASAGLGVASAHFGVRVWVELDRGRVALNSVITRDTGGSTRISHRTQMAGGT